MTKEEHAAQQYEIFHQKVTWKGETRSFTGWSRHLGIPVNTLVGRFKRGQTLDEVFAPYVPTATGRSLLTSKERGEITSMKGQVPATEVAKKYKLHPAYVRELWRRMDPNHIKYDRYVKD